MMPLMMGYSAFPFLGKVTRHDMIVSIWVRETLREIAMVVTIIRPVFQDGLPVEALREECIMARLMTLVITSLKTRSG